MNKAQVDAFLKELSELTRKHKIVIHGCGCCGSPSLWDLKDDEENHSYTTEEIEEQDKAAFNLEWE